ncbi:MAG TPA: 2-amino-4-hydroxy-6-hydroxymethyldihydropteridine diphosphokinase [bacterium]|nr:2-amino-4-hydroxy-6-hydroxymethyldihydropteridine diphosphokinase [bacterium]
MEAEAVYLGLGSNLGDRERILDAAIGRIARIRGCKLTGCSSLYEAAPWGKKDQPDFLNRVVEIRTTLTPLALWEALNRIEIRYRRERRGRWEARTLDIDILLFGRKIIRGPDLIIPHPRLSERRFVLIPLNEIVPDLRVPGLNARVQELLGRCPDDSDVRLRRTRGCHAEDPR